MNCKPGQLCMVVRSLSSIVGGNAVDRMILKGQEPDWLLGRCFTVTTIASAPGETPVLWNFAEVRPTKEVRWFGLRATLTQIALPDECLMPIEPPRRRISVPASKSVKA